MLYLVTAYTGYRRRAIIKMTPRNFDLEAGRVHRSAKEMKGKRASRKPLHPTLLAELRDWLKDRDPSALLWPGTWVRSSSIMLKKDLEEAGIPYEVTGHDGITRYADFHALRHTFISALPRAGVNVKHAQELADHTDPRLTMGVYAHANDDDLARAVSLIPAPPSCKAPAVVNTDPIQTMATMLGMFYVVTCTLLKIPMTELSGKISGKNENDQGKSA